jgi:hypothetical protein
VGDSVRAPSRAQPQTARARPNLRARDDGLDSGEQPEKKAPVNIALDGGFSIVKSVFKCHIESYTRDERCWKVTVSTSSTAIGYSCKTSI